MARWFKRGAAAVTRLNPEIRDAYACPLCLTLRDIDELSFEDVPPKSMGGHPIALTCRNCNNTAGAQLDAHMEKHETSIDFLTGVATRPIHGTITKEGLALRGNVRRTEDAGIIFAGVPKANHPDATKRS